MTPAAESASEAEAEQPMEQCTEETLLQLASGLLAQSPPGEFNDVLHDIQAILGSDELLAQLHTTVRERNIQNAACAKIEVEGEEVVVPLTEFNELPDGRFVDPDSGTLIAVNHYNLEVEATEGDATQKCEDALRLAIRDELGRYVKQALPKGRGQVYFDRAGHVYGIVLAGERFQLQNMRNGQWHSAWRAERGTVKGTVRAIAHYFEDGNVQLNTHRAVEFSWTPGEEAEASAKELVDKIRGCEDDVQLAVNEAYGQLADTTFKKLRRQLPVTRTKVDWDKLASYKVGDQLAKQ